MHITQFRGLPSDIGNIKELIAQFRGPHLTPVMGTVCYDDTEPTHRSHYNIDKLREDRQVPYFVEGHDTISDQWISFDWPAHFIEGVKNELHKL